jgi:hypothetical protein
MRRHASGLVGWAATAGVLAAVALTGCGLSRSDFRDSRDEQVALTEVSVNGGSGTVTVKPGGAGSVHISRHLSYVGKRPGETDRMEGSVLRLDTGCGPNCSVDYELAVPPGVRVSGQNGSGDLDLANVATVAVSVGSGSVTVRQASGDVNVETGSGDIELTDGKGNIVAKTGSGAIRLSEISGNVAAETGSGDIRGTGLGGATTSVRTASGSVSLDVAKAQDVTARTSSGSIRLTVPAGDRYRLVATTSSGRTNLGVPDDPAGEHRLELHTESGGITVLTK